MSDFISAYLNYVGETETPKIYHRWSCISMLGAYLGRDASLRFGHSNLHPNIYVMLIGTPGARKSTAIRISKRILSLAGYSNFSADRTTKEKFLLDLAGENTSTELNDVLDQNLFGDSASDDDVREMYIACDEFNDFIGNGNIEFISMLGNLWDFEGKYENRIKNGKSVSINNPTISIIGGNTPVNFARAFPAEILGQGFFSRLLLIHGESTGRRITFPAIPDEAETRSIVGHLQRCKQSTFGELQLSAHGKLLVEKIYQGWKPIDDARFDSYSNRRLPHLLKLCLCIAASQSKKAIDEAVVVEANTVLTHAEFLMPKAMGEFGKSRHSDVTHKIMQKLDMTDTPLSLKDLWVMLSTELDRINDLAELVRNLVTADKIFSVNGGFLPKKKAQVEVVNDVVDYSILTEEERNMVK